MTVPSVNVAWANVMEEVRSVGKGDFNEDQGFRFRGVDSVVNAVGPALRTHQVAVIPKRIVSIDTTEYETRRGTRMVNKQVTVEWEIRGPNGDSFTAESIGEAADAGDKSISKAQSVAYRVFLLEALCIPTGTPDPDSESHERVSKPVEEPVDPAIQAAIEAADTARGELLARTEKYGWDEGKLVKRYWDDYRKNLRNTHDVDLIKAFGDALIAEAEAQDAEQAAEPAQPTLDGAP